MKRVSVFLLAFLIVSLLASFYQIPKVKAQEESKSFGESSFRTLNWTRFWKLFNAHSAWDLEYNDGSGWLSIKSDLEIIRNYTSLIMPEGEWVSVNKSDASRCKITLNFTASYSADYRLTFGIDLDVRNYTHKEGSWNYTISYQNHTVYFDWTDIMTIPNLIVNHGVKPVGDESWFWFRIRRNNVPKGVNLVIDPSFGETGEGSGDWSFSANYKYGSIFTLTEDGDIDNIGCRMSSFDVGEKAKCMIYSVSGGDPDELLATSSEVIGDGVAGWKDFTISYSASAADYCLAVMVDSDCKGRYTANTANLFRVADTYADGASNPYGSADEFDYHISIYANYTTGAAEYSEEFSETINISASLHLWKALFYQQTETTTTIATAYSWREKASFYTETTTNTEQHNQWIELKRFFTETLTTTETSSFTKELAGIFTETFSETIGISALVNIWKAKLVEVQETTTPTLVSSFAKELLNFFTESTSVTEQMQKYIGLYRLFTETVTSTCLNEWTDLTPSIIPSGPGFPSLKLLTLYLPIIMEQLPTLINYVWRREITVPVNITVENKSPYTQATLYYRLTCLDTNATIKDWDIGEPHVLDVESNTTITIPLTIPVRQTLDDDHYMLEVRLAFPNGDIQKEEIITVSKQYVRIGFGAVSFGGASLLLTYLVYVENKPKKKKKTKKKSFWD